MSDEVMIKIINPTGTIVEIKPMHLGAWELEGWKLYVASPVEDVKKESEMTNV